MAPLPPPQLVPSPALVSLASAPAPPVSLAPVAVALAVAVLVVVVPAVVAPAAEVVQAALFPPASSLLLPLVTEAALRTSLTAFLTA